MSETKGCMKGKALEGVKVLELAWVMAGPITSKYLVDNGATVVRVESMQRPDILRTSEPFREGVSGVNRGGLFAFYGANKYSMALNLRHPRVMEVLSRLISWADIVTENFAPGKIEEMGLGYDTIKKINPQAIMVRISIQGQTGPDRGHPGYGVLAAGIAGITGLTGWSDRAPSTPVAGYTDLILPRFAAATILAALEYRERTGKGQCIDVSQFEATQQFLAPAILDYTVNGRDTGRQGNLSAYSVPHNAYRCRGEDRWCVISVFTDAQWQGLCDAMGQPDLVNDPRFATFLERKKNEPEVDKIVQEWTMRHNASQVVSTLQKAGVPSGVVANAEDLLKDPQLERALWLLDHSEIGPLHHLGQAFTLSRIEGEPCAPAPLLGEHTEYVCRNYLNMSDEEFIELLTSGLFE